MRVIDCFENFYGPDLVNIHKADESFYEAIFNETSLDPRKAIVIEDTPRYLEAAEKGGANVIQACLTGERKPEYRYYIECMKDLPELISKLIKKIKK